ncbi:carbon storage regulator CsrA [Acidaminobacter hydrogenoformans]|uniref:Translational regulator CsrA n=1 Tax=Acidaminobacter hydrogenoformans DSM 2784 TaxID=1120920 RepID=A0A1G5RWJ6_9FIRM|nr:carbon storage regulator CsrA [Acidaminobacter hydrogenoformans]SCZ77821.1 carbon storage regulator, CsrA [Acidaminobacter hydrogenoformans DSM 2784]
MLVLARKKEESLIIDGKIEIVILEAEDGKVKLGINAPEDVKIYRKEILEAVREENQSAALAAKALLKVRNP